MQMQEQQAELEASLQQKQLEVMQAADQFQPVITNLEKVCVMFSVHFMGYKLMCCVSWQQVHQASKLWATRPPLGKVWHCNQVQMALSHIMTVVKLLQHVASLGIDQLLTDSTIDGELLASNEAWLLAVRQK